MDERLWTGPVDAPRRYQVDSSGGGPLHEPGGGVEGRVYRAVIVDPGAPDDGDEVALKLLLERRPEELAEIDERLRLLTKVDGADLMAVRGTFVGTALTDEEHPDPADFDVCYIVSDWIEGAPLGQAAVGQDHRWILGVLDGIARSVDHLHRTTGPGAPDGMVHRDVKPSNIRVRADGSPVLVDYGLTRAVTEDASVVGTPGWLAPEVAAGSPGGQAADVYGVGAIGHDLLVGAPPRRDGVPAAARRINAALDDLPLAHEIGHHIATLLATDPDERPTDLVAWAADLERLLDGQSIAGRTSVRRRWAVGSGLVAAAVVAVVVAATWSGDARDRSAVAVEGTTVTSASALADGRSADAGTTTSTATTSTVPGWVCSNEINLPAGPVADAIQTAYADHPDLCTGAGDPLGDALVLPLLDRAGEPVAALIASPTTPAVYLSTSQYASYRQIVGRSGDASAALLGGYPTGVRVDPATGLGIVDLSLGGMVIGPTEGAQGFWLPQQLRGMWEERGGLTGELGAPTSPVFISGTMIRIEFERGYIDAPIKDGLGGGAQLVPLTESTMVVHPVDPAAELAALGDVADRVLRQSNGTAWYVDGDLVRHWIPDGPTWGCLQANEKVVPVDAPGYAVAALEVGDRARCRR